jgi:hypothetical protein
VFLLVHLSKPFSKPGFDIVRGFSVGAAFFFALPLPGGLVAGFSIGTGDITGFAAGGGGWTTGSDFACVTVVVDAACATVVVGAAVTRATDAVEAGKASNGLIAGFAGCG